MNQFLGDRLQDIKDAIVSAPRDALLEMERELSAALAQVRVRLAAGKSSKPNRPAVSPLPGRVRSVSGS